MKYSSRLLLFLSFFALTTATFSQNNSSQIPKMDPDESIITNTENSDNHKTLLTAVRAADLDAILESEGPFTVFAPSDRAFTKFSKARIANLMRPENKKELHALLTYHIVAGNLTASQILKAMCRGKGKAIFTTVQGDIITATMRGIDIILTDSSGNTAKITSADANQCNGIIHEIDSVILPGKI